MTFDDLHTRAIMPVPFTVCGLELQPLTVGHARVLDAIGLWVPTLPEEVLVAAVLCSGSHRDFAEKWDSWFHRLKLRLWVWRMGAKWDWAQSFATWNDYVAHHIEEPVATYKEKGRTCGMPWLANMRAALCKGMAYCPETFDDQPLAQVILDYHALAEVEGCATITKLTLSQVREIAASRQEN